MPARYNSAEEAKVAPADMDLFIRLHQYAYQPGINRPNPYVDQSKLNRQPYVREVLGQEFEEAPSHIGANYPSLVCESPASVSTWGDSPERFQVPLTPLPARPQSRNPSVNQNETPCPTDKMTAIPRSLYQLSTPTPAGKTSPYDYEDELHPALMHSSSWTDELDSEPESCSEPALEMSSSLRSSPEPVAVEFLEEAYVDLSPCAEQSSFSFRTADDDAAAVALARVRRRLIYPAETEDYEDAISSPFISTPDSFTQTFEYPQDFDTSDADLEDDFPVEIKKRKASDMTARIAVSSKRVKTKSLRRVQTVTLDQVSVSSRSSATPQPATSEEEGSESDAVEVRSRKQSKNVRGHSKKVSKKHEKTLPKEKRGEQIHC
ncbi:hypothetical protein HK104_010728 [Borealophlyctis nickersoniae]|nr:hypothetical protein HK104_010728 [Borealophlyctis nickersoniae]